jgi:uncharacterized protein (TIGR02444 family)
MSTGQIVMTDQKTRKKRMSESFWGFSVRTYRTKNVMKACLSLQDERGLDVNMLLYCCWVGVTRGQQERDLFLLVFEFSENWAKQVVRPLRNVRTWMKLEGCEDTRIATDTCMDFREKVKGVEINAEKLQQEVLETLTEVLKKRDLSIAQQLEAIAKNIIQYFDTVNIVLDEFVQTRLLIIIEAGLIEASEGDIRNALLNEI